MSGRYPCWAANHPYWATHSSSARCTTDSSSDTVLGHGWAGQGYSAATIDPLARGVSWLLAENGMPRRVKTAYLTDNQIHDLAAYAAQLRRKDYPHAA
jgi:S-DNA-T family DNA segregation ATPase FtsK/SpoIIIE